MLSELGPVAWVVGNGRLLVLPNACWYDLFVWLLNTPLVAKLSIVYIPRPYWCLSILLFVALSVEFVSLFIEFVGVMVISTYNTIWQYEQLWIITMLYMCIKDS
jgi:hypothetical protein